MKGRSILQHARFSTVLIFIRLYNVFLASSLLYTITYANRGTMLADLAAGEWRKEVSDGGRSLRRESYAAEKKCLRWLNG